MISIKLFSLAAIHSFVCPPVLVLSLHSLCRTVCIFCQYEFLYNLRNHINYIIRLTSSSLIFAHRGLYDYIYGDARNTSLPNSYSLASQKHKAKKFKKEEEKKEKEEVKKDQRREKEEEEVQQEQQREVEVAKQNEDFDIFSGLNKTFLQEDVRLQSDGVKLNVVASNIVMVLGLGLFFSVVCFYGSWHCIGRKMRQRFG